MNLCLTTDQKQNQVLILRNDATSYNKYQQGQHITSSSQGQIFC